MILQKVIPLVSNMTSEDIKFPKISLKIEEVKVRSEMIHLNNFTDVQVQKDPNYSILIILDVHQKTFFIIPM